MSIECEVVKESALLQKAALYGIKEYVRAKIDPTTTKQFPFPDNYQFTECFLPKKYETLAEHIHNFHVRADDIWIISFPKCGTTWMMNIVWQLKHNLDFSAELLTATDSFLERPMMYDVNEENEHDETFRKVIENMDGHLDRFDSDASPRVFKSHLPPHLLPKNIWTVKPKLIYIYRDAKDVVLSMYHMFKNNSRLKYKGKLEDFFDAFLNGYVMHGPYHDHVNSFHQLKHFDHILLLRYEEMIANQFNGMKRISEFLNCTYNDQQLKRLMEHLSFHNMRKNVTDLSSYQNGFRYWFQKVMQNAQNIVIMIVSI